MIFYVWEDAFLLVKNQIDRQNSPAISQVKSVPHTCVTLVLNSQSPVVSPFTTGTSVAKIPVSNKLNCAIFFSDLKK